MLIDAHVHLWRLTDPEVSWPGPDLPAIHRDFGIGDLRRIIRPFGVRGVVLVQSQPDERDTHRLLSVAADEPRILGVVGWVDLLAVDATTRIIELARDPRLVGLRPMLQDLATGWILNPDLDPVIDVMIRQELRLDALVKPHHLLALLALAKRWPDLGIVIDHAAKPEIGKGGLSSWREKIRAFADRPNVHCKLSGLWTEMQSGQDSDAIAPYVETLFEVFGPKRLIWGSDWPVLTLAGDYGGWLQQAKSLANRFSPGAEADIFGGNAQRFYALP